MQKRNLLYVILGVIFIGGVFLLINFGSKNSAETRLVPSALTKIIHPVNNKNLIVHEDAKPANKVTKVSVSNISEAPLSLKEQVLNTDVDGVQRRQALYILTQSQSEEATHSLAEIAESQVPPFTGMENPHSQGAYQQNVEVALRVTALEALDRRSPDHSEIYKLMQNIERNQKNPTLKFLAQISLGGYESHKPGKLHRVIDAVLAEKE
ncbi:MAG: hypothetical protein ACXVCY_02865 [Pseudobdellovibrionaceae bacterium]